MPQKLARQQSVYCRSALIRARATFGHGCDRNHSTLPGPFISGTHNRSNKGRESRPKVYLPIRTSPPLSDPSSFLIDKPIDRARVAEATAVVLASNANPLQNYAHLWPLLQNALWEPALL
ncbi:hypothetical protein IF2G_10063 [Cordyceps javanica]|nr:hypothetical protein IF2G_10063 [Cordyceps javanica]